MKLRAAQVRRIASELEHGVTHTVLAERYGVTRRTIYDIGVGKTWGHLTGLPETRPEECILIPRRLILGRIERGYTKQMVEDTYGLAFEETEELLRG